jgi:hypothetical protein
MIKLLERRAVNGHTMPVISTDPAPDASQPVRVGGGKPTRRVRKLRDELAERHDVQALQGDAAWTEAQTPRTIRERSKAAEAERLHRLLRDPARRALSTARWRRGITISGGVGLVLALSVSTANVQATVAAGASRGDGVWWFAWTVEPAIAILLLSLFAFRAYMATRGETVEDRWITWTEWALLATTFTLNSWRFLPFVAEDFELVPLIAHGVWPVLAVLIVTCLPRIWAAFGDLDHGGPVADPELVDALTLVREWIATGHLPATPSRAVIERELRAWAKHTGNGGVSTRLAQRVHRCLTGRTELL